MRIEIIKQESKDTLTEYIIDNVISIEEDTFGFLIRYIDHEGVEQKETVLYSEILYFKNPMFLKKR